MTWWASSDLGCNDRAAHQRNHKIRSGLGGRAEGARGLIGSGGDFRAVHLSLGTNIRRRPRDFLRAGRNSHHRIRLSNDRVVARDGVPRAGRQPGRQLRQHPDY